MDIGNNTDLLSYWSVIPSGDGFTSYLASHANDTDMFLTVNLEGAGADGLVHLGSPGSDIESYMRFHSSSLDTIDNVEFSTVRAPGDRGLSWFLADLLPQLAPSFNTVTPVPIDGPKSVLTSDSLSSRPSTPAPGQLRPSTIPSSRQRITIRAAIGGGVGGIMLVLITVGVLLALFRRKRSQMNQTKPNAVSDNVLHTTDYNDASTHRELADAQVPSEMPELPAHHELVEAPALGEKPELPAHHELVEAPAHEEKPELPEQVAEAPAHHEILEAPRCWETGMAGDATDPSNRLEIIDLYNGESRTSD